MTGASDLFIGVEPKPGRTTRAAIYAAVALASLICIPFDLCARLRDRAQSHPLDEQSGADWGLEVPHDGCNAA